MRCHYLSDLHLEAQDFVARLPGGDVLVVAGDLCHATALDPARTDLYSQRQRDRVLRFTETATRAFRHVLYVPGNHDHYGLPFDATVPMLRRQLPGVTVLDDEIIEIGGIGFFGTTLWSDFEGRSVERMNGLRRGIGDYFFIKTRRQTADGSETLAKFQPEDALAAFDRALAALKGALSARSGRPTVVVSHHAPSLKGLDPRHAGNGLDGAYASDLDSMLASLENVPAWVHGHTHIRRSYRIGGTAVHVNCRGFDGRDGSARGFKTDCWFEV